MGLINTWSHSRLVVGEQCLFRAKLAYGDRIPEPAQPNSPAKRGEVVHDELDTYVFKKGKVYPVAANTFKDDVDRLRVLARAGRAEGEQMWCFDKDWIPVGEKDYEHIWARIKVDVLAWLVDDHRALIVDYKTGKRYGNEIKHGAQLQLYAIAAFMKFPSLEEITVELWYLDHDILIKVRYRRDQALRHLANWTERGLRLTGATDFPAQPSTWNCSYCPFKTGVMGKSGVQGTGHCKRNP